LLPDKLVQAYELLAADRRRSIAPSPQPASRQEVVNEQTGRPLQNCYRMAAENPT
jgi:hypothetical protein